MTPGRWGSNNSNAALRRRDLKSRPDTEECEHHSGHAVVQPNKSALLKRLNRIEGQTRGVAKMVEEDRYCVDVLTHISAIQSGNGEAAIDELMTVVKRFGR